jgi:anti-sigma B factor antagonist
MTHQDPGTVRVTCQRFVRLRTGVSALHVRITRRTVSGEQSQANPGSDKLAVHTDHDGDAVIVRLAGEFDLAAADPAREALSRATSVPRQRLIVDLSELTFIDSSGVHVLLDTYRRCRDAEATLTIRPGPPNVQRIFEVTNLVEYLPFEIRD